MGTLVGPRHELDAEPEILFQPVLELDHRAESIVGVDDGRGLILEVLDHVEGDRRPYPESPFTFAHATVDAFAAHADDRRFAAERHLPGEAGAGFFGVRELLRPCGDGDFHAGGARLSRQRLVVREVLEGPHVQGLTGGRGGNDCDKRDRGDANGPRQ